LEDWNWKGLVGLLICLPPPYKASATFSLQDYPFHFLCDGQSLEHEELREFVDFVFCQGEDEVVLAVSAKCQRAVVLAIYDRTASTPCVDASDSEIARNDKSTFRQLY